MKDISRLFSFERVLFFQRLAISILIALILISSLFPLFSVPFDDDFSQFYMVLDDEEEISYKEKTVYVDFDFSGSVLSLFKMVEFSGANASLYYDSYHAVNDCKDGHSLSLRGTAIAYMILEAYDNDFSAGIYLTIMLFVTIAIPIVAALTLLFRMISRRTYRTVRTRLTALNTFLNEHLSGMKIIQVFGREERKKKEFDDKNAHLYQASFRELMVFAIFRPGIYLLSVAALIITARSFAPTSIDCSSASASLASASVQKGVAQVLSNSSVRALSCIRWIFSVSSSRRLAL